MTCERPDVLALVPAQSSALSTVNSTSLAQRGVQDYLASERAERYFCEGREHFYREEFEEAITCLRRGLNLNPNHAEMRLVLGELYVCGLVPTSDYEQLFRQFSIAAVQGNADAQGYLAFMYLLGEGVVRSDQQAFFWTEKAAKQGSLRDQRQLGRLYESGTGVQQDSQQAMYWYERAPDQTYSVISENDEIAMTHDWALRWVVQR